MELFADVPEGTQFHTFDAPNQRWKVNQFQFGAWIYPTQTLDPGQGAFIRNPTNAFSITFTGTAPADVSTLIYPGLNLISSLPLPSVLDHMYIWDSQGQDYLLGFNYFGGSWHPPLPPFNSGEARMYVRGGGSSVSNSVYFNNYAPASGINAYVTSLLGCLGSNLVAQLFWGYPGDVLSAIGAPVPVRSVESGVGHLDSTDDALIPIPFHGTGTFDFEVRIWDIRYGYDRGPNWGRSSRFQVAVSDSGSSPGNLTGWQPTLIGPLTPFPNFRNPFSQSVFEGQNVEFYNPEDYHAGFTFQWQRQVNSNAWADVFGATSDRLVFHPVKLTDGGIYRLKANLDDTECTNTSVDQVLSVLPLPPFRISATLSSNNQVRITGSAVANLSYEIEYSSNLIHWMHFTTLSNAASNWTFLDTNTFTDLQRFYRARVLQ